MQIGTLQAYIQCILVSALIICAVPHTLVLADTDSDDILGLDLEQLMEIEVVASASKFEQKLREAPSSVSVISRTDIQRLGYRTLSELLMGVRGFYTTNDRNFSYTGVRGFGRPADYDTRMLVLINGHRLNEGIYESSSLGFDFIVDIDLIERVEIVRGPSASLYGTNAFFGIINVITRTAETIGGSELSAEAASYAAYRGRATYGERLDSGLELLLSASGLDAAGDDHFYPEYNDPTTNNGFANNLDREDNRSFFGSVRLGDFRLEGGFVNRGKAYPTGAFETIFNDQAAKTDEARAYVDARYRTAVSASSQAEVRGYFDSYRFEGSYPTDYSENDAEPYRVVARDEAKGDRFGAETQLINTAIEQHTIVVGAEFRVDWQDQTSFDLEPFTSYLHAHSTPTNWAAFLQDEVVLTESLRLNLGGRYDYESSYGSEVSPRAGLIISPAESTTLKLLFGRSFRSPSAYELYYDDGSAFQKAPENLAPETIEMYEVVLEQQLTDTLRFGLDGYYYDIDDLIAGAIDPADDLVVFQNLEEVSALGFEAEIELRTRYNLLLRSSYAYQHAEDELSGLRLSNSPTHLVKNQIILPVWTDQVYTGLEVLYTSSRKTLADRSTSGFWLTNLTITLQNLISELDLSIGVFNLFDEGYGYPGSLEHRQDVLTRNVAVVSRALFSEGAGAVLHAFTRSE